MNTFKEQLLKQHLLVLADGEELSMTSLRLLLGAIVL